MRPDVDIPALQIAAGAGVDRCVVEGLNVARQIDLLNLLASLRIRDAHRWNGRLGRDIGQDGVRGYAGMNATDDPGSKQGHDGADDPDRQLALWLASGVDTPADA